ncbi:MAG TPA: ion channel [Thermoanaerobaculia bacterium]|jgi:inward rectifier potassium channel|nr:ion channel [Thermoanaerobaculia bacterium]
MAAEPQLPPPTDINSDLGFGSVVARESRRRLLNRNGSFNVKREGLSFLQALSAYHYFLTISWTRFFGYAVSAYLAANALFAAAYVGCGDDALTDFAKQRVGERFVNAFFFSVDTIATIGYGTVAPTNVAANVVVVFESLIGLLGFALVAGIVFARFARPMAQIVFSDNAIIAPYRGGMTAFMFRIVNQRSNELVQLEAKVMLTRRKRGVDGEREFLQLKLERENVIFFPLTWTIVHPIDEKSPLHGMTERDLLGCDSEFLVMLNGFDETFSQTVHTRSSYRGDEVVWGARFKSIFNPPKPDGTLSVDIRKLHDIERVPLD